MFMERDWRLADELGEDFRNVTLFKCKFKSSLPEALAPDDDPHKYNDHEHCVFCFVTISEYEGDLHEGYCTKDKDKWFCSECFKDFKDRFNWDVIIE